MTKQELLQRLRNEDEVVLLEILQLTSDDIVDKFLDNIEDDTDRLLSLYEEEEL
jgi:hypothetical protein